MFIVVILIPRLISRGEGSRPILDKRGILHIGLSASVQDDSYSKILKFNLLFFLSAFDFFRDIARNFFIVVEFHRIVRTALGH